MKEYALLLISYFFGQICQAEKYNKITNHERVRPQGHGTTGQWLRSALGLALVLLIGRLRRLQAATALPGVVDLEAVVPLPGLTDTIGLLTRAGGQIEHKSKCQQRQADTHTDSGIIVNAALWASFALYDKSQGLRSAPIGPRQV